MSKYFVIVAAMLVLAVACNKKEEAAPTDSNVEQTLPDQDSHVDEAAPVEDAE